MSEMGRGPMDHAAAHERIEDLLLDPGRLADLERSTEAEDVALREHVAGCPTCRADLDAWRSLSRAITTSLPRPSSEASRVTEPIDIPTSLRASVLAGARAEPRAAGSIDTVPSGAAASRRSRIAPLLAMAAALVLVVGSAFVAIDQAGRRAAADAEAAALTTALAAVDRVLAEPAHKVVQLRTPGGANGGSISWSRHDWVVITNILSRPPEGSTYACWLIDDDSAEMIGTMEFAGNTAFWAASVDKWATWEITPTTRFVVTLHTDGPIPRTSPPVLEAALGA